MYKNKYFYIKHRSLAYPRREYWAWLVDDTFPSEYETIVFYVTIVELLRYKFRNKCLIKKNSKSYRIVSIGTKIIMQSSLYNQTIKILFNSNESNDS